MHDSEPYVACWFCLPANAVKDTISHAWQSDPCDMLVLSKSLCNIRHANYFSPTYLLLGVQWVSCATRHVCAACHEHGFHLVPYMCVSKSQQADRQNKRHLKRAVDWVLGRYARQHHMLHSGVVHIQLVQHLKHATMRSFTKDMSLDAMVRQNRLKYYSECWVSSVSTCQRSRSVEDRHGCFRCRSHML